MISENEKTKTKHDASYIQVVELLKARHLSPAPFGHFLRSAQCGEYEDTINPHLVTWCDFAIASASVQGQDAPRKFPMGGSIPRKCVSYPLDHNAQFFIINAFPKKAEDPKCRK